MPKTSLFRSREKKKNGGPGAQRLAPQQLRLRLQARLRVVVSRAGSLRAGQAREAQGAVRRKRFDGCFFSALFLHSSTPTSTSDVSFLSSLARNQNSFATEGTRRSVAALLVVHAHRHPHLLLLQDLSVEVPNPNSQSISPLPPPCAFSLPGGRLRPGEDEVSGLARKLRSRLSPPPPSRSTAEQQHLGLAVAPQQGFARWDVPRERAGVLFRPSFDGELYPYCPAHVTVPKEEISIRVVPLPERLSFAVPEGFRLVAVPLMELHAAAAAGAGGGGGGGGGGSGVWGGKFGAAAAAAPALLSRLALSLAAPSASVPKVGLPPPDDGRMWKRETAKAGGGAAGELKGKGGEEGDDKALVVVGAGGSKKEASPRPSSSPSSPPKKEEEKEEKEEELEDLEDLEDLEEEEKAGEEEAS